MKAFHNLVSYHQHRKAVEQKGDEDVQVAVTTGGTQLPSGIVPTQTAFRLLAGFGIPATPTILVQTADDATAAANEMGFPVAL